MAQQLTNFVKTTLNTTITDVATSMIVDAASSPWTTPPDPAGNTQTITLTDDLNNPTKFEIVTYTGRTGAGPYTLTGCARGAEGTTAQAWTAGAVIVGEATAGSVQEALPTISQADAEAGTSTVESIFTAQRVAQAIAALGGGGGGAWNLIQTQTVSSSVSSVEFTTGITSTYSHFVLVISNVTQSVAGSNVLGLYMSTNGGTTYTTASMHYHYSTTVSNSDVYAAVPGASSDYIELGAYTTSTDSISAVLNIHDLASSNYPLIHGTRSRRFNTTPLAVGGHIFGMHNSTTAVNAMKLQPVISGTIEGGMFSLYGVTK